MVSDFPQIYWKIATSAFTALDRTGDFVATTRTQFGFYPKRVDMRLASFRIETLPGLEEITKRVHTSDYIHREWIYAPGAVDNDSGVKAAVQPWWSRVFPLPKTHVLIHRKGSGYSEFLIWCASFFVGMRLTATAAGFVDATPLKPGALTDFHADQADFRAGMTLAEAFWKTCGRDRRSPKLLGAVVHALFLSQNPRLLQYERFIHLYTALDTAFALLKRRTRGPNIIHTQRIRWMCRHFGMPIPMWARVRGRRSQVAALRNPTFHEALFDGEPLGFAIYRGSRNNKLDKNILLEMEGLVCRLIVALLGRADGVYTRSPVTTRQTYGLDLA